MRRHTLAMFFATLLFACPCNDSRASSDIATYYPLSPGTMTYEYYLNGVKASATRKVSIEKARTVDGVEVVPATMTGPDIKYPVTRLMQKTPAGIYLVGSLLPDGTILKPDIKMVVVKNPIEEGTYFDSDVSFSAPAIPGKTSHFTFAIDKIGESVTVPMGRFMECIKTRTRVRSGQTTMEEVAWLAPKIGVVKRIEVTKSIAGQTVVKESRLAGVDYGTPSSTMAQASSPGREKSRVASTGRLDGFAVMNLNGPAFLIFYGGVILVALLAGYILVRRRGGGDFQSSIQPPSNPDPYETAYLRGGTREVVLLAVFKLMEAGGLAGDAKGRKIGPAPKTPDMAGMSDLERVVYDVFQTPQTLAGVSKSLSAEVAARFAPLDQRLCDEGLLNSQSAKSRARHIMSVLLAVILGLGGLRFINAILKGHSNVGFLVFSAILGGVFTMQVCSLPRLSRLGLDYLKQLQARTRERMQSSVPAQGSAGAGLALLVAVSGISVLKGTPYASYIKPLTLPTSGDSFYSDGGGGGCGGGGGGGCGG